MIVGIGVDLIEIDRVAAAYRRWSERFLRRVFAESEIDYCLSKRNPAPCLAARFAAKEAGFKALSRAGVKVNSWTELRVELDQDGAPRLEVGVPCDCRLHLSLSHSADGAIAVVIAER